jgi:hypothetical protein
MSEDDKSTNDRSVAHRAATVKTLPESGHGGARLDLSDRNGREIVPEGDVPAAGGYEGPAVGDGFELVCMRLDERRALTCVFTSPQIPHKSRLGPVPTE